MKLSKIGICGILSLFFYTAMLVFSPPAYPGYAWLSMVVSDLSAGGASLQEMARQINALYGICCLVSIIAVCVVMQHCKSILLRLGMYFY